MYICTNKTSRENKNDSCILILFSQFAGSFSSENAANDGKWLASVQYWLKAELVGAESISVLFHQSVLL